MFAGRRAGGRTGANVHVRVRMHVRVHVSVRVRGHRNKPVCSIVLSVHNTDLCLKNIRDAGHTDLLHCL